MTAYETGQTVPDEQNLETLASILGFPVTFFFADSVEPINSESASFRSLSSISAAKRDAALTAGSLAIALSDWIEARFQLPKQCLPDLRDYEPEGAADALRALWGLGQRPIKNMIHLLESKGVRVFSLAEECKEVDAFSLWRQNTPFIFLNTFKSGERSRFDAGHELAHLVLHRHGSTQDSREAEKEADAFASAFLMPRDSVMACAPQLPSLKQLVLLKQNWLVSLAALVRRLRDVGLLSEWHYRTMCKEIGRRGFRTCEPDGIPRESSQLLQKVFQALRDDNISKSRVASELHLRVAELNRLVFGLTLTTVEGNPNADTSADSKQKGHLRLA